MCADSWLAAHLVFTKTSIWQTCKACNALKPEVLAGIYEFCYISWSAPCSIKNCYWWAMKIKKKCWFSSVVITAGWDLATRSFSVYFGDRVCSMVENIFLSFMGFRSDCFSNG